MVTQEYKNKSLYRTKGCVGNYKKKLNKINKTRVRLNTKMFVDDELDGISSADLWLSEFLTDATGYEYHMFEHDNWLDYLNRTWALDDELDYCDKIADKQELYIIQRLTNIYQAVRTWQEIWCKSDVVKRVKVYFDIDNSNNKNGKL